MTAGWIFFCPAWRHRLEGCHWWAERPYRCDRGFLRKSAVASDGVVAGFLVDREALHGEGGVVLDIVRID